MNEEPVKQKPSRQVRRRARSDAEKRLRTERSQQLVDVLAKDKATVQERVEMGANSSSPSAKNPLVKSNSDKQKATSADALCELDLRMAQDEARMVLGCPDLLNQFLDAVRRQGLVGEKKAALVILVVVVSRLLERPLNLMLKGSSSTGKNFVIRNVLSLVPSDAVIEITSTSLRAWNYSDDAFSHRVVLLQEVNKSTGPVHPMRLLISEGKLVRLVTERVGGRWITKRYVAKGPIASIRTTTKDRLASDEESRSASLWCDQSEEQTKEIVRSYGTELPLSDFERRVWHEIHHLLEERRDWEIVLPGWLNKVADLVFTKDLKVRRYYPAFVEAWRTIALLRSWQKPTVAQNQIVVDFVDYAIAATIMNEVFAESIHKTEGTVEETRRIVEEISRSKKGAPVGPADVIASLNISEDQAYRLLATAREAGAIYKANKNVRGNVKEYLATPRPRFVPNPAEVFEALSKNDVSRRVEWVHPLTGKRIVYSRKREPE